MVTIKDIAREGGVSVSTVSRALADSPLLPKSTSEKIKRLAEQMGYVKNEAAISLKTGVSQSVGILSFVDEAFGFSHYLFSGILDAFAKRMNDYNYEIFLISNKSLRDGDTLLRSLRSKKLCGVLILCGYSRTESVKKLIESDIPTIVVDGFDEDISEMTYCISSENRWGMYELTSAILRKGHRNIAYICGEDYYVTHERVRGFRQALKESGIEPNEAMFVRGKYYNLSTVKENIDILLSRPNPPTCIFFPDDYTAFEAYEILRNKGYRIGEDISVAGFDGLELGAHLQPRLTTVRQNVKLLGRTAADTLLDAISGKKRPYMQLLPVHVLDGESVCSLLP